MGQGRRLDYSRRELLTLDTTHLNETLGIGGSPGDLTAFGPPFLRQNWPTVHTTVDASGPINWDGFGGSVSTDVSVSGLNRFPQGLCAGDGVVLKGYDDCANLQLEFRKTVDYADSVHHPVPDDELKFEELLAASPDEDGDRIPNLTDNCPYAANPNQSDGNGDGLGDVCDSTSAGLTGFQGFFQPIDMSTSSLVVWNGVKAGQAVPVKWRLTLNGVPVADPDSFAGLISYPVSCTSGSGSIDTAVEELAPGDSALVYKGDGNWQYNWKTVASYKNTCRVLAVKFSYGTNSPSANFKLK